MLKILNFTYEAKSYFIVKYCFFLACLILNLKKNSSHPTQIYTGKKSVKGLGKYYFIIPVPLEFTWVAEKMVYGLEREEQAETFHTLVSDKFPKLILCI